MYVAGRREEAGGGWGGADNLIAGGVNEGGS